MLQEKELIETSLACDLAPKVHCPRAKVISLEGLTVE